MAYVIKGQPAPSVEVKGSKKRFPVRRIFCVGQNYAEHALEMGGDPNRESPFFFTKPSDAIIEHGEIMPFPSKTENLHHEIELVVALGAGGRNVPIKKAKKLIYGYAVGNDFTRRDMQAQAKAAGRPWDMAKGFDYSAAIAPIVPLKAAEIGLESGIGLKVNGEFRQRSTLGNMIWSIAEIISILSEYCELMPGDLIYTGTPAGVGPVEPGDVVEGSIQGLGMLTTRIGKPLK